MKKRYLLFLLTAIIIGVFLAFFALAQNPLVRSEEEIKNDILAQTPIGTSVSDAIKVIKEYRNASSTWSNIEYDDYKITYQGDKTMHAFIGKYNFHPQFDIYAFLERYVSCYWTFNEEGKLIDVRVTKDASMF